MLCDSTDMRSLQKSHSQRQEEWLFLGGGGGGGNLVFSGCRVSFGKMKRVLENSPHPVGGAEWPGWG